ncbi:MAG: sigma-70 family RNA polymerase sigma factor [Gemmatimonadetes bacterium]|nr:sigma-70 family RNA polymerase sigma factor [Gemmatimonadota bacterium]
MTDPAPQLRLVGADAPPPAAPDATDTVDAVDIAALRARDPAALAACDGAHAARLRTIALRFTASVPDAEDVVHDLFARLPDALAHYEQRGQFDGWLTTLTIRAALGHVRHARRTIDSTPAVLEAIPSPTVDGDPLAGRRILQALAALTPALRDVFVLRAVHDVPHAEIARMLGITPNASEVRMHRAVQQLRAQLGNLR